MVDLQSGTLQDNVSLDIGKLKTKNVSRRHNGNIFDVNVKMDKRCSFSSLNRSKPTK